MCAHASGPEAADDAGALVGVGLHDQALVRRQLAGLEQDRIGDGELADVVEQGRVPEHVELILRHVQLPPHRQGQLADAA